MNEMEDISYIEDLESLIDDLLLEIKRLKHQLRVAKVQLDEETRYSIGLEYYIEEALLYEV